MLIHRTHITELICRDSNYSSADDDQIHQTAASLRCQLFKHLVEILTLQGVGIDEVDGAGDTDADTHLTHVAQTLRQPW